MHYKSFRFCFVSASKSSFKVTKNMVICDLKPDLLKTSQKNSYPEGGHEVNISRVLQFLLWAILHGPACKATATSTILFVI